MAVFRVQKTQNYTIMSNHHLRNKALSLKAKGLLSLMLSLPEDWDYTTRGLASICKEGVDSVCATVRELEAAGYIIRRRIRDKNGQMRGMEYTVLEQPQPPEQDEPSCAQPKQAEPKREKPVQENPAQLNTKEINKEETNNVSNPIRAAGQRAEYRALLLKNIEYPILAQNNPMDTMRLDELVELMLDVVCSKRAAIRIAGENMPAEVVKSRFLKLNAEHINNVGFWDSIPLWAVTLIGGLLITVLSFTMILTVYGRMFSLWMYAAIAPIPLSTFAGEPTSSVGKNFIRSYAGVCLQGVVIALSCITFSAISSSPPAVDTGASVVTAVWTYVGELAFNLLVLVGAIKGCDRIVKEIMGL